MTVKELIAELSQPKYEPDMMVVVNGDEGGYEELKWVIKSDLKLNVYRCKTDDPLDHESNMEAESINGCRGPHESVKSANAIEKATKEKGSWLDPRYYNLNGEIVTAVVLPRGMFRTDDL